MVVCTRRIFYVRGVSPFLLGSLCVAFLKRISSICSCIVLLLKSFSMLLITYLKSIFPGSIYMLLFVILSYFDSHPKFWGFSCHWQIWRMRNAALFKGSSVDSTIAFYYVLKGYSRNG